MASLICYGHEFEQTLAVGDGQGILAGCNPWGHKELDTTKQLNTHACMIQCDCILIHRKNLDSGTDTLSERDVKT